MWDTWLFITVSADALAPNSAKASAGTMMPAKLETELQYKHTLSMS